MLSSKNTSAAEKENVYVRACLLFANVLPLARCAAFVMQFSLQLQIGARGCERKAMDKNVLYMYCNVFYEPDP